MQIRRLKIRRFRGIAALDWHPEPGINCLIGPGDVGKSTILQAITTLLSPAPKRIASEHDYYNGDPATGFLIEALLGQLDDSQLRAWPVAPLWTWQEASRTVQAEPDPTGESVLCIRARGTTDLEVEHAVIDPSEGEMPLAPSKRQLFGLSSLGTSDAAYRELRMSRGSLLARNLDPTHLRGLATEAVQAGRDRFESPGPIQDRLDVLSKALEQVAPGTGALRLGMLSPQGQNLLGMVGLFANRHGADLPLANTGKGTQQLAIFILAAALVDGPPLFVLDEVESGLEPFRQRDLLTRMQSAITTHGQAFLTTHSPAVVGELSTTALQRVTHTVNGSLHIAPYDDRLASLKARDPEALLSKLPLLVEGDTEFGLLMVILAAKAKEHGTTLDALGVRLIDGGGQPQIFTPAAGLAAMGVSFGLFVDDEPIHGGKRRDLSKIDTVAFGRFRRGRCTEDAIAAELPIDALDQIIQLPGAAGKDVSNSRYQQLNEHLGKQSRATLGDLQSLIGEDACRKAFFETATKSSWFKTRDLGRGLGNYILDHHPGSHLVGDVSDMWKQCLTLLAEPVPSEDGASNDLA